MTGGECRDISRFFSEAFDERLSAHDEMRLRSHLGDCESCRAEYAAYERLFGAVAALPVTETSAPAPYPETVRAFVRETHPVPWWMRFGTVAAVAVGIVAVGIGAFQAGRSDVDGTNEQVREEARFVAPAVPVARELRAWNDDQRTLGFVLDHAPRYPAPGVVRVIDAMAEDIETRGVRFMSMDDTSLGTLEPRVKRLSRRIRGFVGDLRQEIKVLDEPSRVVARVHRRYSDPDFHACRTEFQGMVRGLAQVREDRELVVDVEPEVEHFILGVRSLVSGRTDESLRRFRTIERHSVELPRANRSLVHLAREFKQLMLQSKSGRAYFGTTAGGSRGWVFVTRPEDREKGGAIRIEVTRKVPSRIEVEVQPTGTPALRARSRDL